MKEHTPSVPINIEKNDMMKEYNHEKHCINCGEKLSNQNNQDSYSCQECGYVLPEYTTDP